MVQIILSPYFSFPVWQLYLCLYYSIYRHVPPVPKTLSSSKFSMPTFSVWPVRLASGRNSITVHTIFSTQYIHLKTHFFPLTYISSVHWQLFKLDSCIIFNGFNKRINSKTQTYVTYAFNIYYVAATILTGTYHCVYIHWKRKKYLI